MTVTLPAPPEAPAAGTRAPSPTGSGLTVKALTAITELVVHAVPTCDHACIIVTPRQGVELVAASDEQAAAAVDVMLRQDHHRTPSLLRSADRIDEPDLSGADTPWPQMTAALREHGLGGVLAHRLRSGERRLGVLVLLSDEPGAMRTVDRRQLASLTMLVSGWVVAHEAAARVGHLQVALDNARLMGRAVGLLMGRHGLCADDAVARLRDMSNRLNLRMHDLATNLLSTHEARAAARLTTPPGAPAVAVDAGLSGAPDAEVAQVAAAAAAVEQALDAADRHAPPA